MLAAYSPYAHLLSAETERKVVEFNEGKKGLTEVTSEIAKYDKAQKEMAKRTHPPERSTRTHPAPERSGDALQIVRTPGSVAQP